MAAGGLAERAGGRSAAPAPPVRRLPALQQYEREGRRASLGLALARRRSARRRGQWNEPNGLGTDRGLCYNERKTNIGDNNDIIAGIVDKEG